MAQSELNRVIQAMHQGVVVHSADGTITHVNQATADALGLTIDQVCGRTSLDSRWHVIHEDGSPFPGETHPSVVTLTTGEPQRDVIMGVHKSDGELVWLNVGSEPLYQEDGTTIDGVVVTFVDISDQVEARSALADSEKNFHSLLDNLVDTYYRVDLDGLFIMLSPSAYELSGYKSEELLGTLVTELYVDPEGRSKFLEALTASAGHLKGYEAPLYRKDGSQVWVATSARYRYDSEGNVCGVEGTVRDITDKKRLEEELHQSEQLHRTIFESVQVGIVYNDIDDRIVKVNPYFCDFIGYSPDELYGLTPMDLTYLDDRAETRRIMHSIEQGNLTSVQMEKRYLCKDGVSRWGETTAVSIAGVDGAPAAVLATILNIDVRKCAEQALRASEAQFRNIVEFTPIPMAINNTAGKVEFLNKKFTELFGWTLSDFSSIDEWWPLAYPDPDYRDGVRASWLEAVEKAHTTGREMAPQHWRVTCKNGTSREVEFRMVPIGENRHVILMNDLTDRIHAEQALRDSEELFRAFFQYAPFGAVLSDHNGNIFQSNLAFQKMLGYSEAELQTLHFKDYTVEEDVAPNLRLLNELIDGKRDSYQMEKRYQRKDGDVFWGNLAVSAVHNSDGSVKTIFSMVEDISDRVNSQREQNKLQRQLQQAQKMEAIGQLTGGIAHDFNNILASILGYSQLALEHMLPPGHATLENALQEILRGGKRAEHLVAQMLDFGRGRHSSPEATNVESVLNEVMEMASATIPSSVHIVKNVEAGLPCVEANAVQLHQVLLNLIINARDAMEGKGSITIGVSRGEQSAICHSCHEPFTGDYVEITVCDSAGNMSGDILERAFDPFFTTKAVGRGTGMGLSMVHGILHDWGGHISVNLAPGEATTFHLYIPVNDVNSHNGVVATNGVNEAESIPVQRAHTGQHLMVVDDEEAIGCFMEEVLKIHGYQVTLFTDSREAAEAFRQQPQTFDLLLTDQTMPHMTGLELIETVHAARPELPVILCTGYSELVSEDNAGDFGIDVYLPKPVETERILAAIESLLALEDRPS